MKYCVIDASFILAFLLKDEYSKKVDDIFLSFRKDAIGLISTDLIDFELCNGLLEAKKQKRISKKETEILIEKFENLHIEKRRVDNQRVLDVAVNHGLTFYDSSYLALARELHLPLLSLDKHLKKYSQKF